MSSEAIIQELSPVPYVPESQWLSKEAIVARINKIHEVAKSVMKKDVHYGTVPGAKKQSLWKPGAELLLSTFRIARKVLVTDLSTDDEVRYRVECQGTDCFSGVYLGSGIGECSSNEEKYKWRRAVCHEEFNATPEDRRRLKWKTGKENYTEKQVRMNPCDLVNTIVKMATKRAMIDLALVVTAASDIFTQDIEDLPEEFASAAVSGEGGAVGQENAAPMKPPQRRSEQAAQQPSEQQKPTPQATSNSVQKQQGQQDAPVISEPQARRFYAIWKNGGYDEGEVKECLLKKYGVNDSREILRKDYDAICKEFGG